MSQLDFAVVANNAISVYFQVLDENGNPVDITGFNIKWQVRIGYQTPALITKSTGGGTIAMINPTQGIFGIPILATDTLPLAQNYYIHEAVTTDLDGNPVTITNNDATLSYGTMFVRQQYTAQ